MHARRVAWLTLAFMASMSFPRSRAQAAWTSRTEGPDIFGQTSVFVLANGEQESMVIQCDDKDKLFIALIFEKKKFEEIPTLPAELLVQIDGGTPIRLSAEVRSWNDSYAGVVAEGRTSEVIGALSAIGSAMRLVNAGVTIAGHQDSASFEADGSTNAVAEAFKGCKLRGSSRPPAS